MRRLLTMVGIFTGLILLCVMGLGTWIYFYTADLPSAAQLNDFNPTFQTKTRVRSCDGIEHEITVMP
jgi:membrane carboxypeptidase/penicillin-binding protein